MRRFVLLCLLVPVIGMSQTKNVVSVQRMFAKADKVLEFEKAIGAHAQKYHTGDAKWRVYDISSGPDAGGYQVVEGPFNWAGLDARGNLGAEHTTDWNKSVAVNTTEGYQSGYYEYQAELSTVALTDFSNKIQMTHWYPKLGQSMAVRALIAKMKKLWESENTTVAVYVTSASGPTQYVMVTRYKNGFKDRDLTDGLKFKDRYEKANGPDSFDEYLDVLRNKMDRTWSELLEMRPELGSK
jgi:hypothetical protein